MTVVPYKDQDHSKKKQVAEMFNNISKKYDFLNHFLSFGIDVYWRKKAIRLLKKSAPKEILDVATGTGDFAINALSANPDKITGIDISEGMLEIGRKKIKERRLEDKVELMEGDSEQLQFKDEKFDAVISAFGVRNFENLDKGLKEMNRVLKKGGTLTILEFSKPAVFPVKQLYLFYFYRVLPLIGKMVSKDQSAYTYLPESVNAFPEGKNFLSCLAAAGFYDAKQILLNFGIASIYMARK